MEHRHLFVLCPPASGSTLAQRILATSPNVAAMPEEGQTYVPEILFTPERWNPALAIDWEEVRRSWERVWDPARPVRLEKSPPHLLRAGQLEKAFAPASFVVMVRDPYAFCEGLRRRWGARFGWYNLARFWAVCAGFQRENLARLGHVLELTYEELTGDPAGSCGRLLTFLPALGELHPEGEFGVHERRMRIENLNPRQIGRLSPAAIAEISDALAPHADLLDRFGYRLIEPGGAVPLLPLRRLGWRAGSWFNRPGPVRWVGAGEACNSTPGH